jgi:hypothetical protein
MIPKEQKIIYCMDSTHLFSTSQAAINDGWIIHQIVNISKDNVCFLLLYKY